MSSLYETPSEKAARLAKSTSTGNFFQDSWTDFVSSGITLGEDGQVKRDGAAWWFQGLTPGARSIAEQKQGLTESRTIDRLVQGSGLTEAELKKAAGGTELTASNTSGIISKATRDINLTPTPVQQATIDRSKRIDQEGVDARKATNAISLATLKSNDAYRMFESGERANERAFNRKENDLNRKQERELADSQNSLQMQMAIMQNDLADKRMDYDRETARMDKRSQAIAQLMSGIGALGGAFAL